MKKLILKALRRLGYNLVRYRPRHETAQGAFFVEEVGFALTLPQEVFLVRALPNVRRLNRLPNSRFQRRDDGIFWQFNDLRVQVQTQEDIYILHEIFYEGDYNCHLPQDCVVVDVGMNVGIASLFFAQNERVRRVFSFEPVAETFAQAQRNLAQNPALSRKITPQNVGLYDTDTTWEIDYTYDWKGSVGVRALETTKRQHQQIRKITIPLRNVADALRQVRHEMGPAVPLVMKIDCEGSEYAILQKLAAENLLTEAAVYLFEWHEKGPEELRKLLINNGFMCLSRLAYSQDIGMLYAFKTPAP